jgi:hypothetical protein
VRDWLIFHPTVLDDRVASLAKLKNELMRIYANIFFLALAPLKVEEARKEMKNN